MSNNHHRQEAVTLVGPPYHHLRAVDLDAPVQPQAGGWVMTWNLGSHRWADGANLVANRLAGVSLATILPKGDDHPSVLRILHAIRAVASPSGPPLPRNVEAPGDR